MQKIGVYECLQVYKYMIKRNRNWTVSSCYRKNFAKLVIPSRPNSFARIEIASQKGIKFFRDSIETDFSFKLVKRVKFASNWFNLEQRNQKVSRRVAQPILSFNELDKTDYYSSFRRTSAKSYRPWTNEICWKNWFIIPSTAENTYYGKQFSL